MILVLVGVGRSKEVLWGKRGMSSFYYFGHSTIVNPIAWRLAQARGDQEIIAARLDPDPLRYVTWGSKSQQSFDHLEDRNLALCEEILEEARSRFEPGKRLPRSGD